MNMLRVMVVSAVAVVMSMLRVMIVSAVSVVMNMLRFMAVLAMPVPRAVVMLAVAVLPDAALLLSVYQDVRTRSADAALFAVLK